jgi:RNA polymerase sigma factor (sigma-70 family)
MQEPSTSQNVRRALSLLLDAQGDRLYATIARLTLRTDAATDLFQELFVRLSRHPGFGDADDPTSYAFRTAINLAMEWRRRRRAITAIPLESAAEVAAIEIAPLQRMIRSEEHERLLDALSELNQASQRLFILRFVEEQPYALIAKEFKTTPHRARGLCHAAMRQLRQRIAALDDARPAEKNPAEKSPVEKSHV